MPYADPEARREYMKRYHQTHPDERGSARRIARRVGNQVANRLIIKEAKDVPCADCGERYPPYVMDFDHVRGYKLMNVSMMVQRGFSAAKMHEEIAKCEVVCANCHRQRTFERSPEAMPLGEVL